jgi:titin
MAVVAALALQAGCDADPPLAPEARQALLVSRSASGQDAPSSLTATAASPSHVDLAWQDQSANKSGFEVYRSTGGPSGAFTLLVATGANVAAYTDAGLAPSTEYCYQVRSFRATGRKSSYSAFSTTACATTPLPTPPSGVHAKPAPVQRVDVSWIDNSATEDGFRVERSFDASTWIGAGTVGPNVTSFSDAGLASEQRVCYRVIAFQGQSAGPPSTSACTTPPASPTSLSATAVDPRSIDLAWIDNSAAEDGYEVQRNTDVFGTYSVIAGLPANAVSYRDAGLAGDVRYFYRVRAKKDGGVSDFSDYASAVLASTPPNAPLGTSATPRSSTVVDLTWVDNSANEDAFRIERSTDGGASWASVGTSAASQTVFVDGGRASERQVCYHVIAFNRVGESPPSNTGCTTLPAGPTDLTAIELDAETIDLIWVDNSGVEDGYAVYRYFPGDYVETVLIAVLPPNSTSYRIPPGTCGELVVRAQSGGGFSDFSSSAFAWREPCPQIGSLSSNFYPGR